MILTLRKIKGDQSKQILGGQSRDIVRGGPVKKTTLYLEDLEGGQSRDLWGGANLETFSGKAQWEKKHPVYV